MILTWCIHNYYGTVCWISCTVIFVPLMFSDCKIKAFWEHWRLLFSKQSCCFFPFMLWKTHNFMHHNFKALIKVTEICYPLYSISNSFQTMNKSSNGLVVHDIFLLSSCSYLMRPPPNTHTHMCWNHNNKTHLISHSTRFSSLVETQRPRFSSAPSRFFLGCLGNRKRRFTAKGAS